MKEYYFSRDNFGEFFAKFAMYYRLGVINYNTVIRLENFLANRKEIRNEILNGFRYFPDHPTRKLEYIYHGKTYHDMAELISILSELQLSRLELDGVRISGTIDLSSCFTLEFVSITNCRLNDRLNNNNLLNLPSFVNYLSLEGCKLRTQPNLRSTRIQKLFLQGNNLITLDLTKLPGTLEDLDVSYNGITEISGDFDFPQLDYLTLECNLLKQIPDVMISTLTELNISENRLTEIPRIHDNLVHLYANFNLLVNIPLWIASIKLDTLEVEGNPLSSHWFRSLDIGDILCDEVA